jgi:hypothetical protein
MSMQTKPSIVFVQIWADGSSFGKVIPTLQAEGYEVVAAQQPGHAQRRRRTSNPHAGGGSALRPY